MSFAPALSRIIALFIVVVTNVTSLVLSSLALHERTGGVFQVLVICWSISTLLVIIGCLYHQFANRGEEASNTRNVALFGVCGLLAFGLATSLTVHARQDNGAGLCKDFATGCLLAGVQLGMAYVSFVFAMIGFIIAWFDKLPGVVKVTPRYPITKAPSSHFAAYGHDLDGSYAHRPVKTSFRPRDNSGVLLSTFWGWLLGSALGLVCLGILG